MSFLLVLGSFTLHAQYLTTQGKEIVEKREKGQTAAEVTEILTRFVSKN